MFYLGEQTLVSGEFINMFTKSGADHSRWISETTFQPNTAFAGQHHTAFSYAMQCDKTFFIRVYKSTEPGTT